MDVTAKLLFCILDLSFFISHYLPGISSFYFIDFYGVYKSILYGFGVYMDMDMVLKFLIYNHEGETA